MAPLTVGFDATSAARQSAGIGRYTRELLRGLAGRHDVTRYRLFYCSRGELHGALPPLDSRFRVRRLPLSDRVTNALWQRLQLPFPVQAITGRFDVFHSPDFTLPPVAGAPSVVTVHDLAFLVVPECAYPTLRAYLEIVVPRSIRRATRVIAVSTSTANDLQERLGVPASKITVIPEAVSTSLLPAPPSGDDDDGERLLALGVERPYILSVSTLEPRKNYVRLLEAYAALRRSGLTQELVIAGRPGWLFEPIFDRLQELGLRQHVRFITPGDEALGALYRRADAFVYPSLYEGFGIPPLEAMASGAPVACSNTASLPEIVGDAALTFDPHDVDAIAGALMRILTDDVLSAQLRAAGPKRAAVFDWRSAADATHRIYEEVAGGG
jgi:glycosyltransferase involved in cell wall biosynthesis